MNNVIYRDDKEYPSLLKKTNKDAPKQLYYKMANCATSGESHACATPDESQFSIFDNCLSVVGSRKLTSYGKQAGEQIVSQIASAGITIISGFMYGGDALAHQAAVRVGGRTIAVMPCGIDLIHPEYQAELYQDILDNQGMIISEYEGDMKPALWTYPRRNRIVAGLSQALLVIEAGEKSGTLITVNYAKKFKRKIFVLPGPITSSMSKGSNLLIKQGAEMVTRAQDILEYYARAEKQNLLDTGCSASKTRRTSNDKIASQQNTQCLTNSVSNIESQILELLAREPLTADELSRDLEIPSSELGVKLSIIEMKGIIKQKGGKYYVN